MRSSMRGNVGTTGIPERVGRYEILLPIGTGGMATVYLARTLVVDELYRDVALKLMHPHLRTEDGELAAQLVQEAKVAASIRHPNVVPVLEVAEDLQGVYLVMEYVEGATLSALIRAARAGKRRIPAGIAGRIITDALTGLHAAHELRLSDGEPANLVHRDFSPQNLLVGTDGVSRLTDFGIAKVTRQSGVTAAGVIKGKVGYMSPEQALGRPLDRRCDVWASGVVAWELLAQRRLFKLEEEVAALLRIVSEPAPRIRTVRPDIPQEVDEVLAWAMTQDVNARCPNANELRRAMLKAWRKFAPLAEPPEVGAFVREMLGEKLEQRAQKVQEVLALRLQMSECTSQAMAMNEPDSISISAQSEVKDRAMPSMPRSDPTELSIPIEVTADLTTIESSSWVQPPREAPWPSRKAIVGVAASLLAGGLAIVAWRASVSPDESLPTAVPATALVSASHPIESASPVSPATGSAPHRSMLLIRANEPMTSVRVGKRSLSVFEPTEELEVRLSDSEQVNDLEILAKAQDGRRAKATVVPASGSVFLLFPARVVHPYRPPATKKPPGLAPTPYEN